MVDDTTGRREEGAVDAARVSAEAVETSTAPGTAPGVASVASGSVWQEGGPGFGVIKLRGLSPQGEPVGNEIRLGVAGCSNHSFSITERPAGAAGIGPGMDVAWVESAFGDVSGIGRIMFQRCGVLTSRSGEPADAAGLAAPANDNATWVADGHGAGALGCRPAVASLDGGGTLVAWVGTDGNAHGRLYSPSEIGGTSPVRGGVDAPEYAAVNAALADLGPVIAAPDADRRVQIVEPRPGNFAVMWLALAEHTLVLRGNLFVTPPDTQSDDGPADRWAEHKIADIRLPNGATGEFSLKAADQGSADIVVSYAQLRAGTNSVDVLARRIEGAGTHVEIGQLGAEYLVSTAPARNASSSEAGDHGAVAQADFSADMHNHEGDAAAGEPAPSTRIAVDAGVDATAPVVKAIHNGFLVAWHTPGTLEGTIKITMAMVPQPVASGSTIISVTDSALAAVSPAISGFGSGAAIGYVSGGAGNLVVEAFNETGAQIGTEVVVDEGSDGAITEIAIASLSIEDKDAPFQDLLAVVYVQDNGDADGDAGYGNIMLQQYGLPPATETGPQQLVALGGDGQSDGEDDPVQLTMDSDGDGTTIEGVVGRAPSVTDLPNGDLAIVWVESNGAEETIKGCVVQPDGEQVLRIDLTGLLGESGIAEGTKPTLLDTSGGDIVVSWLQPDGDDGDFVVMAALYKAAGPGTWIEPDQPIRLQEFESEPRDFSVTVSEDDSTALTVTWRADNDGRGGGDKVLSQRYDIDGNDVGRTVRVADNAMPAGEQQLSAQTLSAAGLLDGQIVVVYTEQRSNGDVDLAAQIIDARSIVAAGGGTEGADTGAAASISTFATNVDQEIAIDVVSNAASDSVAVSQINGVPITPAAPVDVGSGWVQLREDGRLTVSPNVGFTGSIAFDCTVSDTARHIIVNVAASEPQVALELVDPVTTPAEDVSTTADIKVAELATSDEELSTRGLSIAGLDADMFKIVGTTLYLKAGIDLDLETKPTLSIEIRAGGDSGPDEQINFTLDIENASASNASDSHAFSDTFVFAPGLGSTASQSGQATDSREIIDLSSSGYATFQQLLDSGALVQDGADVVITTNPDDPAHSDKIILRGIELSHLTSSDFKL